MKEDFGIDRGIDIYIRKNIPAAAGMAGGSTDAAAVMTGMNKLFDLNIDRNILMEHGLKLGADVPYWRETYTAFTMPGLLCSGCETGYQCLYGVCIYESGVG